MQLATTRASGMFRIRQVLDLFQLDLVSRRYELMSVGPEVHIISIANDESIIKQQQMGTHSVSLLPRLRNPRHHSNTFSVSVVCRNSSSGEDAKN
jgi:hypothetical protein